MDMKQRGYNQDQIVEELTRQGYRMQQISDAINQAEIKSDIYPQELEQSQDLAMQLMEAPSPSQEQEIQGGPSMIDQGQYGFNQFRESVPQGPQGMVRGMGEQIQEIAEAIVDEKWRDLTRDFGDINLWKESLHTEVESVKQEILRVETRIERLEQAIIGRVKDYQKSLTEVNTEMQALGKVFEKILKPLTNNIKELSRITKDLKEKTK